MSIQIRAQPLQFPKSSSAPSTFQALLETIAQYTLYLMDQDYILLVKGPNTPQAVDQNKVWLKTDGVGRPLGLFIMYNGKWRQVATGNPAQITMYAGDWNTYFDSSGLGLATLPWDGWAIANGNNGTMNLTNKFIVPGYRCDGWNLWVTNVDGYDAYSGGRANFQIALNNLPYMSITFNVIDGFQGGAAYWAPVAYSDVGQGIWTYPITGTGSNNAISLIPPYIALGFAQFIGYTT
jgi:hypothetical protein